MFGLSADLPYPSEEGIVCDAQTVRLLAPAYADRRGELTAILQYVYQSMVFSGRGDVRRARLLADVAVSEMHHLDLLGGALYRSGALPVFTSRPPRLFGFYTAFAVSFSASPQRMILDDIASETEAIRGYEQMLPRLRDEAVAAIVTRILADEKLHLETFRAELESLCREGGCGKECRGGCGREWEGSVGEKK